MTEEQKVTDWNGVEIKVGTHVRFGDNHLGKVTKITDADADYDDELERAVEYPPRITVQFDDGEGDEIVTTYRDHWTDRWLTFQTDDLTVVPNG